MTVVVAGGGIGGLATAIALARAGVAVTVVERAREISAVGSGLVLAPNGIKALDALSPTLGAVVRAAGHVAEPGQGRPWLTPSGAVLSIDPIGDLGPRYGAPQVSLMRSVLQSALLDEAGAAGAVLRTGVTVDDHTDHEDLVEVALADGTTLTADALIGADGINSVVRRRMLADGPPRYCGYTSVRGQGILPDELPNGFAASDSDLHLFAAPTGGGRLYWAAKFSAPDGVWPGKDPRVARSELLGALAGWHMRIVQPILDADPTDGLVITDVVDRDPTPQWTFGRVTLLGDAAHPMSPAVGQGASLALEDAVVLAQCLRMFADVPAALAAYSATRAPRAAKVLRQSRQGRTVVVQSGSAGASDDEQFADLYGWQSDGVDAGNTTETKERTA